MFHVKHSYDERIKNMARQVYADNVDANVFINSLKTSANIIK